MFIWNSFAFLTIQWIQEIRPDRVPEELWIEFCDIVQETVINTNTKIKKCKNTKWLSEKALQITEKRAEANGKEKRTGIPI